MAQKLTHHYTVQPVNLHVSYSTPDQLIRAYAAALGRGTAILHSPRDVPRGTQFHLHLAHPDVTVPVVAKAYALSSTRAAPGYRLIVQYERDQSDAALLHAIELAQKSQTPLGARRSPRLPVQLFASEDKPYSPTYVIDDASLNGVGIVLASSVLPDGASQGAPVRLGFYSAAQSLQLAGHVVRIARERDSTGPQNRLGIEVFDTSDARQILRQLRELRFHDRQRWRARIKLGP